MKPSKFIGVFTAAIMCVGMAASSAFASTTYSFTRLSSNGPINVADQLRMVVTQSGTNVLFTFFNDVGVNSSIVGIYFDDHTPQFLSSIGISDFSPTGVSFTPGAIPAALPPGETNWCGNDISPYNGCWSADSDKPPVANGVNLFGEFISFLGELEDGQSYAGLINALNQQLFRVGLKVQGIDPDGEYSDWFVSRNVVPLPAAAWLFGSALLGFVGWSKRRKV
jgi:hypothetical protein